MVRPPRERPSASRSAPVPDFVSFEGALCARPGVLGALQHEIGGRLAARSRRVLRARTTAESTPTVHSGHSSASASVFHRG